MFFHFFRNIEMASPQQSLLLLQPLSEKVYEKVVSVVGVQFDILGNEEIRRGSCIDTEQGITYPETYENSEPKIGGLIDPRLGTMEYGTTCATCGLTITECPGHYGHIKLASPVFNWGYINSVKNILSCICLQSGKLLVPREVILNSQIVLSRNPKHRFHTIRELCQSVKVSPHSGIPVPKLTTTEVRKSVGKIYIVAEYVVTEGSTASDILGNAGDNTMESITDTKKRVRQVLTAADCYNILRTVSDEDCEIMGILSRPEDMIIRNFIIPPIAIRPYIRGDFSGQGYMENQTTHKLVDIVKFNNRVMKEQDKALLGEDYTKNFTEYLDCLAYHIASYYDNESMALPRCELKNSGKILKSITSRFKGKNGRIRQNLQGKRVDYSARSVITSDPNNALDELGVPLKIAMIVTYPEVVTFHNLERLGQLVKNARSIYPGANYVEDRSITDAYGNYVKFDLKYRNERSLKPGDILHRHLQNGDVVLFNRQPSLHKMSMMAHRVRIIDNPSLITFRLNVTATQPYNADFDGDEMNMFVPQSEQAKIELKMLADIKNHIISPRDSNPIVKLKQDSLIGAYRFTLPGNKLNWRDAMNIMAYTSTASQLVSGAVQISKKGSMSGNEVFSMIIPSRINYEGEGVVVENGTMKKGTLSNDQLGKKNGIPHLIMDSYGKQFAASFMDDVQRLTNTWLMQYNGFCIGFGDVLLHDPKVADAVRHQVESMIAEGRRFITENENNRLLDRNAFEKYMWDYLNGIRNTTQISKQLDNNNNLFVIVSSGAKGAKDNINQVIGCVGQLALGGKLLPKRLNRRLLPYFPREDDSPEGRGFIKHGFIHGLNVTEYFYHNVDSRSGIIDTAIKTADTGYMQRKTIKATEDVHLAYDNTVRSATKGVVQFIYGDSGFDSAQQMEVESHLVKMDNETIKKVYGFQDNEMKQYDVSDSTNRSLLNDIVEKRDKMRMVVTRGRNDQIILPNKFYLPFNLVRIINYYRTLMVAKSSKKVKSSVSGVLKSLNEFLSRTSTPLVPMSPDEEEDTQCWKHTVEDTHKTLFTVLMHEYLSPHRVLVEYGLDEPTFNTMLKELAAMYIKHLAEPGEMVGILAAQSIGEPLTQFTLNTFHHAGVADIMGANASAIDRFRELIHFTKNVKSSFTKIYLEEPYKYDKEAATSMAAFLMNTLMADIAQAVEIHYLPGKGLDSVDNTKPDTRFDFASTAQEEEESEVNNPWLLRIIINREELLRHQVSLLMIKSQFARFWEENQNGQKGMKRKEKDLTNLVTSGYITSTKESDPLPCVHIRFDLKDYSYWYLQQFMDMVMNSFVIKGFPGIANTKCVEQTEWGFDAVSGSAVEKKEYVISVEGTNLTDIFYIEGIDKTRTYTTDIHSILDTYGIEATRSSIIHEANTIFGTQSKTINYQHISILADIMTHVGTVTAVNRYGITKLDTDPLSRVSFEKSIDQLVQAAVFHEEDTITSVSSRIITGRVFAGGTGSVQLYLDTNAITSTERVSNPFVVTSTPTTSTVALLMADPILREIVLKVQDL